MKDTYKCGLCKWKGTNIDEQSTNTNRYAYFKPEYQTAVGWPDPPYGPPYVCYICGNEVQPDK